MGLHAALLLTFLGIGEGAIMSSTLSCDSLSSCSPASCVTDADPDCSFSTPTYDFAAKVAEVTCKTCTQDTSNSKCINMATTLKNNAGIKAAYCTADFLVVWATGLPRYAPGAAGDYLNGVPLPPGGDTACRVRTAEELLTVYKIPLTPPADVSGSNIIETALPGVTGLPAAGAIGMAIDGVPLFPNYNNRGLPAATSCEIDRCSAHSGKGELAALSAQPV